MRGRVGGARRRAELDAERVERMKAQLAATNAKGEIAEQVQVAYFGLSGRVGRLGYSGALRCACD